MPADDSLPKIAVPLIIAFVGFFLLFVVALLAYFVLGSRAGWSSVMYVII